MAIRGASGGAQQGEGEEEGMGRGAWVLWCGGLAGELEGSWVDEACGQQAQRDRLVASFHKASLPYPPFIFEHPHTPLGVFEN